jgi:hypothetical protein
LLPRSDNPILDNLLLQWQFRRSILDNVQNLSHFRD